MKKLLIALLLLPFAIKAQTWVNVGSAGFSADTVNSTSIAIDGSSTPYVVYQDASLSYGANLMKYNGSSWVSICSSSEAGNISMAIDGTGTPYVVYTIPSFSSIPAVVIKDSSGSCVPVGSIGWLTYSTYPVTWVSMAINGSGTPYVVYNDYASSGNASVIEYIGSSWHIVGSGFSRPVGSYKSIAIDGTGTPYVAFGGSATVMKFNGSSWVNVGSAGFSAGNTGFISIAIDGSGTPYVAYMDVANGNKATVMKFNGSSWVNVGSAGFSAGTAQFTSIAIDGSGNPYIVYEDGGNGNKATVMKFNGSSWVNVGSAGFSAGTAGYTSIAIDGSGTAYVAYEDGGNSDKATVMSFNTSTSSTSANNIGNQVTPLISIYPNPNKGLFTVNTSTSNNEDAQIIITNILGVKVKKLTIPTNKETDIQLQAPAGIYFISVVTKSEGVTNKIIIE